MEVYVTVSNYLLSSTNNIPSAFGARIDVPSKLDIPKWRCYLPDDHDQIVCDFLQYGSINYCSSSEPEIPLHNHSSALSHKLAIDEYISVELAHNATQGPFDPLTNPFKLPIHKIPLMTVPKKGADSKRRVVLDFSHSPGTSVNDGIPKISTLTNLFTSDSQVQQNLSISLMIMDLDV